ncbi:DUF397 domain-containing protein [Streptomyces acidiscabies]|nr:DUF397 domain-containing protein [Streptomyces acidiscabies]
MNHTPRPQRHHPTLLFPAPTWSAFLHHLKG